MKLLILTQAIDTEDPVLGFFVRWVDELAKRIQSIEIICLIKGTYSLPPNVLVHSLGKERGAARRIVYVFRFFALIWKFRHNYDAVLVHMNQEYVILGGWLWRLLGKRVYMWRNFHTGNVLTDSAIFWCEKVFCTSMSSYTARRRKTVLMPVGIDIEFFKPEVGEMSRPHTILSLGRIAPVKKLDVFIEALGQLAARGILVTADIYGDALPQDASYLAMLKARVESLDMANRIRFHSGIPNREAPALYRAHEIFFNMSPSGMYDKTIFEAAACGVLVLASSTDWAQEVGSEFSFDGSAVGLADKLAELFALPDTEKDRLRARARGAAKKESLATLVDRLVETIVRI